MPLSDFTYYLTTSGEIEVNPLVNDLIFEEAEDRERGGYVRRLSTELVFAGADFDLLYDNYEVSGQCAALPFSIKYKGGDFYQGVLRIAPDRGRWDVSNRRYRANIEPSGEWACLTDGWENEFNIFLETEVTVNTFLGTLTEYECGPVSESVGITVNGYFEQNVSGCLSGTLNAYSLKRARIEFSGGVYNHYATWVTEQITTACSGGVPVPPPGDGWVLITDNCPTSAIYGRAPQMVYDGDYRESSGLFWDNRYSVAGGAVTEIDNGVLLNDLLENRYPCGGGSVVSDFFGINPSGDYPSGSSAYTEALENLQSVVVFQKSDVKLANASNNATIGTWTYKAMLESLRTQFNVDWRVQSGGVLRIEHVSFFDRSQGLDLTSGENATRIAGLYAYEYDGNGLARFETWQWMEGASQLFEAQRIQYGDCVGPDAPEEIVNRADRVNNDVGYIQANPDQIADDGFVFANTYISGGQYYFVTEASEFGGDLLFNGHMSWPNLMEHYHRWRRPLPAGVMNNVQQDFESSVPRKQQTDVSILLSPTAFAALDAEELVKTQMGWGEVVSLRYSAASCRLTLKLRHE